MITLTTNGNPLPSALLADTPYVIHVKIDGHWPIESHWALMSGMTVISHGEGSVFRLQVADPGTYSLSVSAIGSSGHGEESIFVLPVSSRRATAAALSVRWDRIQVAPGKPVAAVITYTDPEGATSTNLSWTLYWNNNIQDTGTATTVTITSAQHGIYRIVATATDATGAIVTADSTLRVSGQYEVLHAIVPTHDDTTMQYLGCLYSDTFSTVASVVTYLPFEVATFLQDVVLLPGTTHVRFVLDETTDVDDEIVVRTNTGNWAVIGPPAGLTVEPLIYDYSLDKPYIPAPADRRLAYTLDVWNVHGYTIAASNFRVKVECYYAADPIYEYHRCSYSEFPGGKGERQRRLIAVIENLEVDLDAIYGLHRGGTDSTTIYTTQIPDRIPVVASAQGTPCAQLPATGTMHTEANLVAFYDPPMHTGLTTLAAKGVYGLSGLRPYTFTLSIPQEVPLVQRVRRAYGQLAVYMAGGGVNEGSTVTVRIRTNKAPGYVEYTFGTLDVYNPDTEVYEMIGEASIDVSDYGFDIGGLSIEITIND